jgi:hypothetical protein
VVLKSGDRLVRPILSTDEPTADDDAIIASTHASDARRRSRPRFLNGAIGAGRDLAAEEPHDHAQRRTRTGTSTIAIVKGLDAPASRSVRGLHGPNAGNAVLTGTSASRR